MVIPCSPSSLHNARTVWQFLTPTHRCLIAKNVFLAGAFDFTETNDAPPKIAALALTHESLPWRRRKFEQDAILAELIKSSGLSVGRLEVPASFVLHKSVLRITDTYQAQS